jgi:hypothetical protein
MTFENIKQNHFIPLKSIFFYASGEHNRHSVVAGHIVHTRLLDTVVVLYQMHIWDCVDVPKEAVHCIAFQNSFQKVLFVFEGE